MHLSTLIVVVAILCSAMASEDIEDRLSCASEFGDHLVKETYDKNVKCSKVISKALKYPVFANKCQELKKILVQMQTECADLDMYNVDLVGKLQDYILRGLI